MTPNAKPTWSSSRLLQTGHKYNAVHLFRSQSSLAALRSYTLQVYILCSSDPCGAADLSEYPQQTRIPNAKMVYIRQDKLPKLIEYKYQGVDHSLVSRYIMKPFYTHVVIKLFPMSMA